jgi:hypothetical protein
MLRGHQHEADAPSPWNEPSFAVRCHLPGPAPLALIVGRYLFNWAPPETCQPKETR